MYWANFLHIYQPPDQRPEILERIVNESYRPLLSGLEKNPEAAVTLNINAVLTELLAKQGFADVIEKIKKLAQRGQLEFTGSAKYHPFLPLLPQDEARRQIELNDEANERFFGKTWQPRGFFPPEMGYAPWVGKLVAQMGFAWLVLDEIAAYGEIDKVDFSKTYRLKGADLSIFFRERRTSNLVMAAMVRSGESLAEKVAGEFSQNRYLLTAMDGETFGHHRPGHDRILLEMYASPKLRLVKVSDLLKLFPDTVEVEAVASSWASSGAELERGEPYYLYFSSKNRLHRWQKQLQDQAIKVVHRAEKKGKSSTRPALDRALSCNWLWWANPDAWWSIEEIELGAHNLWQVVKSQTGEGSAEEQKAAGFYQKILTQAFAWQRGGAVRRFHEEKKAWKKIPFAQRAKPGEYQAILEILRKEMKKATEREEFEAAIRWRDAIYKLERSLDIYDVVHVVDQLRSEEKLGEYAALTEKYKKQYRKLAPGQPDK